DPPRRPDEENAVRQVDEPVERGNPEGAGHPDGYREAEEDRVLAQAEGGECREHRPREEGGRNGRPPGDAAPPERRTPAPRFAHDGGVHRGHGIDSRTSATAHLLHAMV